MRDSLKNAALGIGTADALLYAMEECEDRKRSAYFFYALWEEVSKVKEAIEQIESLYALSGE